MIRRRQFLKAVAAGSAGLVPLAPRLAVAEPPPETTRLRLIRTPGMCWAPQYVAEELLRAEGFTDVSYFSQGSVTRPVSANLAAGEADMSMNFVGPNLVRVDQGDPVVFLAGVHVGCFELFGAERVRRSAT